MSTEKKRPLKMTSIDNFSKIPNMGRDNCKAYDGKRKRVETLFVDSSGFGSEREPAMTVRAFKNKMSDLIREHGHVYAGLEGIGQFQVYVAVWSSEKA